MNILQWYEMLPEDLRDEAQAYACDDGEKLECEVTSLASAISIGFLWHITDEGFGYWREVCIKAPVYQRQYEQKHNFIQKKQKNEHKSKRHYY